MKTANGIKVGILASNFLIIPLLLPIFAFCQKSIRINFAKGADSTVVSGSLNGYKQTKNYRIRVHAGQTLKTEQVGDRHDITIFIQGPSDEDVGDSDASCNNRRDITPTVAGDYKIQVVECRKADPWKGSFRFRVTVR